MYLLFMQTGWINLGIYSKKDDLALEPIRNVDTNASFL